jgi:hypothetical protein
MVVIYTTNRLLNFKKNIFKSMLLSIFLIFISACNNNNDSYSMRVHWPDTDDIVFNNMVANDERNDSLQIDEAYKHHSPLAELVNVYNYCDTSIEFILDKGTNIKIFAVGEMMASLAKVPRKYYFGNDELELYFSTRTDKHPFNPATGDQQYIFTWLEEGAGGQHLFKNGIGYKKEVDSVTHCIKTEITIPWSHFKNFTPASGKKLSFDFAAADNDDGIRQKGKIAWNCKTDSFLNNTNGYGLLYLTDNSVSSKDSGILYSFIKTTDSINWQAIVPCYAVNVVAGNEIKNNKDCSAEIKSCWDKHHLYFNIRVNDVTWGFRERFIKNSSKQNLSTFFDHGWIEDHTGKPVWNMNVLYSRHAGGAIKNQLVDTVIRLGPGHYRLRYVTDESHAFNAWDDAPPLTPFYGIRLYRALANKNRQ